MFAPFPKHGVRHTVVSIFATPHGLAVACKASLSMKFSMQECWWCHFASRGLQHGEFRPSPTAFTSGFLHHLSHRSPPKHDLHTSNVWQWIELDKS